MNKLLICVILLISADTIALAFNTYGGGIPAAIQTQRNLEVKYIDIPNEPSTPHVFEVEPIQSPLRIVFNSQSNPVTYEQLARLGVLDDFQSTINEDEYKIVDQYQRYRPVKVVKEGAEEPEDSVVISRPTKEIIVPEFEKSIEEPTTVVPVAAPVVAPAATSSRIVKKVKSKGKKKSNVRVPKTAKQRERVETTTETIKAAPKEPVFGQRIKAAKQSD